MNSVAGVGAPFRLSELTWTVGITLAARPQFTSTSRMVSFAGQGAAAICSQSNQCRVTILWD